MNSIERDPEHGAHWEVEVTEWAGHVVDVRLDRNYELVVVEADTEEPDPSR